MNSGVDSRVCNSWRERFTSSVHSHEGKWPSSKADPVGCLMKDHDFSLQRDASTGTQARSFDLESLRTPTFWR